MSAKPLIVLGVDGLDWDYVDAHRTDLPVLSSWPVLAPLASIFPPDSIPAWTTIFTGIPPGEHGYLDSIDYLDDQPDKAATTAAKGLPGRTFWDEASRLDMRVCVVNPFLAYPSWDVNGVMVAGPVFVDGQVSVTGADSDALAPFPQLGGIVDFPNERTMETFVEETLATTREQADFGLRLLQREPVDLFFINILTIDRMQHFAWRFVDPGDPTYPGPNKHSEAVLRSYKLIDEIAADYVQHGRVIMLSDHGHGRRCARMVYMDELLRRAGLVSESVGKVRILSRSYLVERAKRLVLRAAYELGQEARAYNVGRRLPNRKAIKYSSFSTDSTHSQAQLSRTFGRNQHSGIELHDDTPEIRRVVIDLLEGLVDPKTGEKVTIWAREREEVVTGANVERYPAILFKLADGYGVDFGIYGGLFAPDVNHRRISGGHKPNGVFASSVSVEPPADLEAFYDFIVGLFD